MRPDYREALAHSGVVECLVEYDASVAGTPPLGLDLPGSDIDILCHAPDAERFAAAVWRYFSDLPDFSIRQWRQGERAVIAGFTAHGWVFEIFGHPQPVADQAGWRHFEVERRLLAIGGPDLREAVMACRMAGLKTEPAFAAVLGLEGDPYRAMLDLAALPDANLAERLASAGF